MQTHNYPVMGLSSTKTRGGRRPVRSVESGRKIRNGGAGLHRLRFVVLALHLLRMMVMMVVVRRGRLVLPVVMMVRLLVMLVVVMVFSRLAVCVI
jgi:hypothetical protein